jgi:hypothetical protein
VAPTPVPEPTNDYYILANSSSAYLTDEDLATLTKETATYAINEIYARHGKVFKSTRLQNYFLSQKWYTPDSSYNESVNSQFNEYEQANVDAIYKYQVAQGWRS